MSISKAWQWSKDDSPIWLTPCEESYYLAHRWREKNYDAVLDLGCGLGRHAVYFAKMGFDVSAFDLSEEGVNHLTEWASREGLKIEAQCADMLQMPYGDDSFDCVFAYHVISHTDTKGIKVILSEIKRVLKPGGEFFITLCSKDTWAFTDGGFPSIDPNTIVKDDGGAEEGIPHFYVSMDDIMELFSDFRVLGVKHTDDCYYEGRRQNSKHYFILGGYGE